MTNKHGLEVFYAAFRAACGEEFDQQKRGKKLVIDNQKFFFAIILLSKVLFYVEQNPFEAMFSNILVDKLVTGGGLPSVSRLPKSD